MKNIFGFLLIVSLVFTNSFFSNFVFAEDVLPSEGEPEIVTEDPEPAITADFLIRVNETVVWQGSAPVVTGEDVNIFDNVGNRHQVASNSVLGVLKSIDESNDNFSMSNLQYYDSFGSFYLKCIASSVGESCDNWQYAVGGITPWSSIDQTLLSGGETVGIYFGTPHNLALSKNEVLVDEHFTATAQKYNYLDNTWSPLTGVSVGVTLPNPTDQWNPIVVASYGVDSNGSAEIFISEVNNYTLGIVEAYYFPAYSINVLPKPVVTGGGSAVVVTTNNNDVSTIKKTFNLEKAFEFLKNNQDAVGSFGGEDLYTDWTAIAYGANNLKNDNLLSYLKLKKESYQFLTDNERRAMALMALNENPHNFNGVNYIAPIVKSFDGLQFGDPNIINDDVFAIIVLSNVGYVIEDELIHKTILYIISKQKENGSWEDSVDLTSVTIQMLKPYENFENTQSIITNATKYIENKQKNDGGFDGAFSTSWVMQLMKILNINFVKENNDPFMYLANLQQEDGGVLVQTETIQSRIWATSYAIPAFLGKTWGEILYKFPKELAMIPDNIKTELLPTLKVEEVKQEKKIIKKVNKKLSKTTEEKIQSTSPIIKAEVQTDSGLTANVLDSQDKKKEDHLSFWDVLLELVKSSIFSL